MSLPLIISLAISLLPALAAQPPLKQGDIVFQTSQSAQSQVIQLATGSPLSHTGIIEVARDGIFVIEAIGPVSRTPWESWKRKGRNGAYSVYRDRSLSAAQARDFVDAAKSYLGAGYDIYFSSRNNTIYCSELVDLAAKAIQRSYGTYQALGSLNIRDRRVIGLMKARWQGHPACQRLRSFEECLPAALREPLISPVSISRDRRLSLEYSSF